jgi:hypothetical protein
MLGTFKLEVTLAPGSRARALGCVPRLLQRRPPPDHTLNDTDGRGFASRCGSGSRCARPLGRQEALETHQSVCGKPHLSSHRMRPGAVVLGVWRRGERRGPPRALHALALPGWTSGLPTTDGRSLPPRRPRSPTRRILLTRPVVGSAPILGGNERANKKPAFREGWLRSAA